MDKLVMHVWLDVLIVHKQLSVINVIVFNILLRMVISVNVNLNISYPTEHAFYVLQESKIVNNVHQTIHVQNVSALISVLRKDYVYVKKVKI